MLLLVPLTSDAIVLTAMPITYGIGFASVASSTAMLLSDLCTSQGSRPVMGFLDTMIDIGQAAGPIITGLVVASALGYLGGFFLLSILLFTGGSNDDDHVQIEMMLLRDCEDQKPFRPSMTAFLALALVKLPRMILRAVLLTVKVLMSSATPLALFQESMNVP